MLHEERLENRSRGIAQYIARPNKTATLREIESVCIQCISCPFVIYTVIIKCIHYNRCARKKKHELLRPPEKNLGRVASVKR